MIIKFLVLFHDPEATGTPGAEHLGAQWIWQGECVWLLLSRERGRQKAGPPAWVSSDFQTNDLQARRALREASRLAESDREQSHRCYLLMVPCPHHREQAAMGLKLFEL